MDYPLENLDPERFQKLSQALITKEYPNVQCFPVAQPDGGRDAVSFNNDRPGRGFIMYQIKFVRNPTGEDDPHQWLVRILKQEAPKLKQQIPNGVNQYILITNISGTAHPEVGSIDQLHKLLNNELGVPSACWWRDDICRRLDNSWDLKWAYPELMTGPDLIRAIVEQGLSENRERRSSAIRAFVKDQFDKDQEVRFKQVDLQNKLLELYIDVPVAPPQPAAARNRHKYNSSYRTYISVARDALRGDSSTNDSEILDEYILASELGRDYPLGREEHIGTASFLLHSLTQQYASRIVLEGAPGQGKSTITQYVSQVHRMKILRKDELLQVLPSQHRDAPPRLPFKIDLRDLATWLSKQNPFSSEDTDAPPPYWQRSLESFLAAQVRYHSGGVEFDVNDLIAVAKLSSILLVFDGLDEVADIVRRREVVEEIIRGVSRLEENTASLQVVVTSRPAAFANSPGLPEDLFPYFHLTSVTRPLIEEYTDKWLRARKLYGREASDVKNILREKLNQPHLRDLARNTMQLTILLSLIHTRGSSLPDKRTALYDSYVELFFNRESEKSSSVREHRDLLINIHRYLAWILHIESEQGNNTGSITEEKLHTLLADYLKGEGYEPSLARTLFTGMVERVVALVSRVEGTYEFEVQPLREYFAARYLYETAPYSPPGNERGGTKPDRFDAIARNFYWLNVTRFYAGCYSKGELPSLIDRLQDLENEEGYCLINHPRNLAAMLLSDWVFTQHPKSVQQVVEIILGGLGLRHILISNGRRAASGNTLILSKQNGRDELIKQCFEVLHSNPQRDYALSITELIKSNLNQNEIADIWYRKASLEESSERTRWLSYGLNLGILSKITLPNLQSFLADKPSDIERLSLLMRARRFDYIEIDEGTSNIAIKAILNRDITIFHNQRIQSFIELFGHSIDASRYVLSFLCSQPVPLSSIWETRTRGLIVDFKKKIPDTPNFDIVAKCQQIIDVAGQVSTTLARNWASEIAPWDLLVEEARRVWGDYWAFYHIANISGGIKSSTATCKDYSELFDHSMSLCCRARYARLRAGNPNWWHQQAQCATELIEKMFLVLSLITWGSIATIGQLLDCIDDIIKNIPVNSWITLYRSVREACSLTQVYKKSRNLNYSDISKSFSERTAALLTLMLGDHNREKIFYKYFINYRGDDSVVLQICQQIAMELLGSSNTDYASVLEAIENNYKKGIIASDNYMFHRFTRQKGGSTIPSGIAKKIASNPASYPTILVNFAEAMCRDSVASHIVAVGEIARRDIWFDSNYSSSEGSPLQLPLYSPTQLKS